MHRFVCLITTWEWTRHYRKQSAEYDKIVNIREDEEVIKVGELRKEVRVSLGVSATDQMTNIDIRERPGSGRSSLE